MGAKIKLKTARKSVSPTIGGAETTYEAFVKMALCLPGVEASTSYGTPSLKVKGKLLCRLRTEAEGALALMCDFIDREMLLQAAPDTFFITDHYANYPMILVRLNKVLPAALPDLLERAWRMRAPKKLVQIRDQESAKTPPTK